MAKTIIVGAGLAGLITACKFTREDIYEAGSRGLNHKALLRFRDESVSDLTGIKFKQVTVRKGIWNDHMLLDQCDIQLANLYSRKVTGNYSGRSIWDLATCQRYIAPNDFYDRLVRRHGSRIHWDRAIRPGEIVRGEGARVINTAPLPVMMELCGMQKQADTFAFNHSSIHVDRYQLPEGADVYQTIYFPESDVRVFRASITGDVLIVESVRGGGTQDDFDWALQAGEELEYVVHAFGLKCSLLKLESVDQKYGKIVDLPREKREAILYELTRDFNVFSVGRFATWRNILLDDVVKDLSVVERLLAASQYGRELVLANR
jgi:hypothetical protein